VLKQKRFRNMLYYREIADVRSTISGWISSSRVGNDGDSGCPRQHLRL